MKTFKNLMSKLTLCLCLTAPFLANAEILTGVYINKSFHDHFADPSHSKVDFTLVDPKTNKEYLLDLSLLEAEINIPQLTLIDAEVSPNNDSDRYTLISFSLSSEATQSESLGHDHSVAPIAFSNSSSLLASATTQSNIIDTSALTPNVMTRRVAYVLYEVGSALFSDKFTDEELFGEFIGENSMDALYKAASYGQLDLVDDVDIYGQQNVFGPYLIEDERSETECYDAEWANTARIMAEAEGVDFTRYQNVIYIGAPGKVCPNGGVAKGSNAYVRNNPIMTALAHEFGHLVGLGHAGINTTSANTNECLKASYGDYTAVMGNKGGLSINAPYRDQLGWFDGYPGSKQFVRTNQTATLYPLQYDLANKQVKPVVIKVPTSGDINGSIYIAYHRNVNQFGVADEYDYTVTVHNAKGGNCGLSETLLLATLREGETYEHNADDLTVEFVTAGDDFATLSFTMDEDGIAKCSKQQPRVEFSTQQVQTTNPDDVFDVTVKITNLDNSAEGKTCAASTYVALGDTDGNAVVSGNLPPTQITLSQGEQTSYTFQLSADPEKGNFGDYELKVSDIENVVHIDLVDQLPPVDENPGDENPGDENPGDENPGDENPSNENPGDENPGDENPGDENPGDENPGDENPGDENPGDENPGDENPGDENPGDENPADENPGDENPGDENPGDENPGNENPGNENPSDENPGNDNPGDSNSDDSRTDSETNEDSEAAGAGSLGYLACIWLLLLVRFSNRNLSSLRRGFQTLFENK